MKRALLIAPIAILALAVMGATDSKKDAKKEATPDHAKSFKVSVDTIEGCSCPLFCGCYFNGEPNDPHMCEFNNVYRFREKSHYGDVDLTGATVWMSGDLGGEWGKQSSMPTEWVVITFDRKVTPPQRQAIGAVFAKVFPVKWKKQDMREDDIEWQQGPVTSSAKMKSGKGEITLAMWNKGPNAKSPTVIKNLQYWGSKTNEGFVLAKSTHHFDGDVKFEHKEANGFTIRWSLEGPIETPAAQGAQR